MKKYLWLSALLFIVLLGCNKQVIISASINDPLGGTITGSGTYKDKQLVELEITLNDDYDFVGWFLNDAFVSSSLKLSINPIDDATYLAKVEKKTVQIITTISSASGTTSGDGLYAINSDVSLLATINDDYDFIGWYKNEELISTEKEVVVKATNAIYEAKTKIKKYEISFTEPTGCKLVGNGIYSINQDVTIIATLDDDYDFLGWFVGDDLLSEDKVYSFKATESVIIKPVTKYITYDITVQHEEGTGTVTGDGEFGITKGTTLTFTPNAGFVFVGWYFEDTLISEDLSFEPAKESKTYIAKTTMLTYTIVIENDEGCTASGSGVYDYNTKANLTAVVLQNFEFVGWYSEDTLLSNELSIEIDASNITIKVITKRIKCSVKYIENDVIIQEDFIPVNSLPTKLDLNELCLYYDSEFLLNFYDFTKELTEDTTIYCNKIHAPIIDGDNVNYSYINYGSYPSTRKDFTEEELSVLTKDTNSDYYVFEGKLYEKLQPSPHRNLDNGYYPEETYYFLVEPIRWIVLEVQDGLLKLLSEKGLECKQFSSESKTSWELSSVRTWLNNEFYNKAFTDEQRALIVNSFVDNTNQCREGFESKEGLDTYDHVYLLSHKEAINPLYGFNTDYIVTDPHRLMQNTNYCTATGGVTDELGNGAWLLRSPTNLTSNFSDAVRTYGTITGGNHTTYVINACRPVIQLQLK